MITAILLLSGGLVLLVVGAEFMVRGAARLAAALGLSGLFVGLIVVAFATSSPELVVAVQAGLRGAGDLAMGNVVGSNICNIALILGLTALVTPIPCRKSVVKREVPLVILATGLFWLMARDDGFSPLKGWILISLLLVYIAYSYRVGKKEGAHTLLEETDEEKSNASPPAHLKNLAMIALGLFGLVLGSDWLVDGATTIARALGWSNTLIGVTVVAIGTSLPEVATSLVAALRREPDIAVGNVLGSNLWNLLGVGGVAAVVSDLPVEPEVLSVDFPVAFALIVICLPIMWRKGKITRPEGLFLLLLYALFLYYRLSTTHS